MKRKNDIERALEGIIKSYEKQNPEEYVEVCKKVIGEIWNNGQLSRGGIEYIAARLLLME